MDGFQIADKSRLTHRQKQIQVHNSEQHTCIHGSSIVHNYDTRVYAQSMQSMQFAHTSFGFRFFFSAFEFWDSKFGFRVGDHDSVDVEASLHQSHRGGTRAM